MSCSSRANRTLILTRRILLFATSVVTAFAQSVPFIDEPLVPSAIKPGGPGFILTVSGTGFQSASTVLWSGASVATTYISSEKLTARIPASKIASPETVLISVSSGPKLLSNQVFLPVVPSRPVVAFTASSITGAVPRSLTAGDLNGDGQQDLVSWTSDGIEVLLGNGNGTFQSPIVLPSVFYGVNQILAADVNGDGNLDLVVLSGQSGQSDVFLGNGNGTFQSPIALPLLSTELLFAAAGDFNGDGKLDLAYCGYGTGPAAAAILLGNGDGTFILGASLNLTGYCDALVTADLNGDGFLDIALATSAPEGISIFLNDGTGAMIPAGALSSALPTPFPFVLADLNGDGVVDVAAVDSSYTSLDIFLGNGDGTFQPSVPYSIGSMLEGNVIAGDFNGDGKLDLIVPWEQGSSDAFSVLLGNGDGTFRLAPVYAGTPGWDELSADFNNDGKLDLAAVGAGQKIELLLQTSVLAAPSGLEFPTGPVTSTSLPLPVTVSNIGSSPLKISALHLTGEDPAAFILATDLCSGTTLSSGGSCSFTVKFAPTLPGPSAATVTISDNAQVAPQSVPLHGVASEIEVSPASLNFGSVKVDHASAGQIVTIANLGSEPDNLGISVSGLDPQDFLEESTCPVPLLPGTSCSLLVRFIPTSTGMRTASISISDPVGVVTLAVSLAGTGN